MRRNRNSMHRGGNGGSGSSSGSGSGISGGPLLTEHLKDIDLELELLKRKREMLEKQQYLQPLMQPMRSWKQQPYSFNQSQSIMSGSNCDFSHLYNDGPHTYRKPFGKKRQSDSDWQHDNNFKRFSGPGPRASGPVPGPPPVRNQRPFNPPGQQSKAPKFQGKPFIGQKIANQRHPRPERNFAPTKITKPTNSPSQLMNTIASQPMAVRNDLVATAIKSVAEVESIDREALRLHADKEPTKQMTGRLELALGGILRDVRELCAQSPYHDTLRIITSQRIIKQHIRERIRTAMIGKIVGHTKEIVSEYRTMFPKETDVEIVNAALLATGCEPDQPVIVQPIAQNASDYYKINLIKLMDFHLSEMFDKMHEIYNKPSETEDGTQDQVGHGSINYKPGGNRNNDTLEDILAKLENAKPDDYMRMLPRLLKKHMPAIIKMLHINKYYKRAVGDLNTETSNIFVENGKENPNAVTTPDVQSNTPVKYTSPSQLPYYVKVMGKPQLPKRKLMAAFLEAFHPRSIKKHRSIHNLLFIGFSNKTDFEGILKADGTVLGRSNLSIRMCETNKPDHRANTQNANVSTQSVNGNTEVKAEPKEPSSEGDIIGSDLDGQITDLLTTIRDAEQANAQPQEETTDIEVEKVTEDDKPEEDVANGTTGAITKEESKNIEDKQEDITEQNGTCETAAEKAEEQELKPEEDVQDQAPESAEKAETTEQSKSENMETETSENMETETSENMETETSEKTVGTEKVTDKEGVVEKKEPEKLESEKVDQVTELKNAPTGRSTPTRSSSRLANAPATPSSIRTRRASRFQQN